MTEVLVRLITENIAAWGYAGIFFLMVLESACLPVPSEIIMVFGGFLVFQGKLALWPVVLAGTVGNLVGSWIAYYIGKRGGRPLLLRYGKYLLISEAKLEAADRFFQRSGSAAVFFGRLLPVVRTFISLPAGVAEMSITKFSAYTFFGSLPWSLLLAYIGISLGANWRDIIEIFHRIDYLVVLAALVTVVSLLMLRRRRS